MAVAAVDAVVAHVMLVAELNRLLPRDVLICQIRRPRRKQSSRERQTGQEQRRKDTEPRDEIRAVVKNLSHVNFALWR